MTSTVLKGCAIVGAMPGLLMIQPAGAEALPPDGVECIDFLYRQPSLVGSAPRLLSWSKDSRYLAFVWDESAAGDDGIWIYEPSQLQKRRLDDSRGAFTTDHIRALDWLDGERIVAATRDVLYEIDLNGSERRVIPTPPGELGQVESSPDGRHVAVIAGGGLWLGETAPTAASEFRAVYNSDRDRTAVESFKWSAGGNAIAFVVVDDSASPKREIHFHQNGEQQIQEVTRAFPGETTTHREIGVFSREKGTLQWLKEREPTDLIWSYEWSEEGTSVLIDTSDVLARTRRVTAYDVGEEITATTYHASRGNPSTYRPYWSASWAPRDDGVILLSDHEGFYHLYQQRSPGAPLRPLTAGSWEIAGFDVDRRNGYVYFIANRDHAADRQLYRVSLRADAPIERVSEGPGTYTPSYSPSFERLAFLFSDDGKPPDAYYRSIVGASTAEQRRVTRSPRKEFDEIDWAKVEYVEFASHVDNTPLYGRLYTPADFDRTGGKYPLVVGSVYSDTLRNNWGGRSVHPTWGLDQCLVAHGYLVFSVNVRGSWGQGREFRRSRREFGNKDIDDIESGVRHLVSQGVVDSTKVAIWGSSYGGLMTTMSLFKKPGFYAAGIAGAPATNVFHAFPGEMRVMGTPSGKDFPARYLRQSSLYYSDGLQEPLMIIHGTRDTVVFYGDSIALAERLIAGAQPFELVTLPGVGHHWDNEDPATTRFVFKKMIAFLGRYLDD